MKLIKINSDHYVMVDDSEIKKGDIVAERLTTGNYELFEIHTLNDIDKATQKVVTHSTRPLEDVGLNTSMGWELGFNKIHYLSITEVKELLGEVDVEVLARKHHYNDTIEGGYLVGGFINGYNQSLEDNKDKKYTEEDMIRAYTEGENVRYSRVGEAVLKSQFIQSLQPKTQWDVEFIDGELKLK